jgi:hypothetical protein
MGKESVAFTTNRIKTGPSDIIIFLRAYTGETMIFNKHERAISHRASTGPGARKYFGENSSQFGPPDAQRPLETDSPATSAKRDELKKHLVHMRISGYIPSSKESPFIFTTLDIVELPARFIDALVDDKDDKKEWSNAILRWNEQKKAGTLPKRPTSSR